MHQLGILIRLPGCQVGILGGQLAIVGTGRWFGGCIAVSDTPPGAHRRIPRDRRLHPCFAPAPRRGPLVTVQVAESAPLPLASRSPREVASHRWDIENATRIAAEAGRLCLDAC